MSAQMQTHTTSTRIVTRDGRQHRKVTCSCGHYITTTDSAITATEMALHHIQTPVCPQCDHRNVHNGTGCTYEPDPMVADAEGCACTCGNSNICPVCGHPGHYGKACAAPLSPKAKTRYYTAGDKGLVQEQGVAYCVCKAL